ncbi:MAG: hypothetical protein IKS95_06155, partial [Verrucomicrobia bacterium]|nr:hypothetical protein [Verrucomicrobiota bacterium]
YAVISFPETGERFDFFFMEGGENYVRQCWGDDYEELYKATFKDPSVRASDVVYEWFRAIAEQTGDDTVFISLAAFFTLRELHRTQFSQN